MTRLAAVFLAMVPAAAFAQSEEQRNLLVKLVEQNGCAMTSEVAQTVLPANGLDRATSIAISRQLFQMGLAKFAEDEETLVLTTPACS